MLDGKDVKYDHRQLNPEFIAYKLSKEILSLPTMRIKSIQDLVQARFHYNVKYMKAWKTKKPYSRWL
jgi:hypothetical protein